MTEVTRELVQELGLPNAPQALEIREKHADDLGHSCPDLCPQHYPQSDAERWRILTDPLGEPISIGEVAKLIGCSTWTVRNKFVPAGLPHDRLTREGKLFFYRAQVMRWLIQRQKGEVTAPLPKRDATLFDNIRSPVLRSPVRK